jgi:hypothetical protein
MPKLNLHEEKFASTFIVKDKRGRYLSLLESERGRKKILSGFHHCHDLDSRFATRIPPNQQSAQTIAGMLKSNGAPTTCYVMSEDPQIDGREMDLDEALAEVVGKDAGAFLSCIPGKLGYFEMEGLSERYLLLKK